MGNYKPTEEDIKLYITTRDPALRLKETTPFSPIPFSKDVKEYYIVREL